MSCRRDERTQDRAVDPYRQLALAFSGLANGLAIEELADPGAVSETCSATCSHRSSRRRGAPLMPAADTERVRLRYDAEPALRPRDRVLREAPVRRRT